MTRVRGAAILFPAIAAACKNTKAAQVGDRVKSATAIAQMFGDGQKLTAVAVEFDRDIDNSKLSMSTFKVEGRTITKVYANTAATTADKGTNGKYAIVELLPDDPNAALYTRERGQASTRREAIAKDKWTLVDNYRLPSC